MIIAMIIALLPGRGPGGHMNISRLSLQESAPAKNGQFCDDAPKTIHYTYSIKRIAYSVYCI